jgi:deazaflavin-dependent oxidoreductase (nitroreductase family)
LKAVNPINRVLLGWGIGPAPQHLLSITGRRTGRIRTTPVALVNVSGDRYAVAGFSGSDWVKNARAAGRGTLRRGRQVERVTLVEVKVSERGPILAVFAKQVRGGQAFLTVPSHASVDVFAEAGARHPVFRVRAES